MATNNLRTKISDLPLCEDTTLLNKIIGIGIDGKTYRVNKNDIGVEKWTNLSFTLNDGSTNSGYINANEFENAFNIGGKMHMIVSIHDGYNLNNEIKDLEFIMGSNISIIELFSGETRTYFNSIVTILYNSDLYFLALESTYTISTNSVSFSLEIRNSDGTNNPDYTNYVQIDNIWFEPLPFINIKNQGSSTPSESVPM